MRTLTGIVSAMLLVGCASSKQEQGQVIAPTAQVPISADPDVESAGPPVTIASEEPVDDAPVTTARAEVETGDHRPAWWFDEAQWSEQRVTICVEVLGADVLETRRASVDEARQELRRLVGEQAGDGEIVLTSVKPLPVPAEVPGGHRYAGYVMITCALAE